jgi:hypothetical protein
LPFEWPQIVVLDLLRPGWDAGPDQAIAMASRLGKNTAAAIAALAAMLLWLWLDRLGLGRVAFPVVLAASLGSDMWSTGSQALWQHGPAALCLTLALLGLSRSEPRIGAMGLSGFWLALMVACRPIDLVFAVPIVIWARLRHGPRAAAALLLPAGLIALALGAYNVWFFKTPSGGYAQIEQMHPWAHGVQGTWTGHLGTGLAGTLLSPSHGLFVYCPWALMAVVSLPGTLRRQGWNSLEAALAVGLAANLLVLAKYSCWWAGHCFGPRFWIDATPVISLFLAHGLSRGRMRFRALVLGVTLLAAMALQAIGFLGYPSTWHGQPTNADLDHRRLWDWCDSEVSRCVREGIKPRTW